ncbi:MAG: type II toxin-antitoxin system VapC family toxin [Gammaproteobacteria bacterium]|nr:type II toxin-antitoxin system VapC family toxin [Gammaproteobacteria bacterium]MDD9886001.1 type II toxin-antitoxin system VapC family toxin [Gammaproteobacteria bacterium]
MILVDTSVWIDHLRTADKTLTHLLDSCQVLAHPFVIGEIACGSFFPDRDEILLTLRQLPALRAVEESEALYFIDKNKLMGLGISYVDVHLLAATALEPEALLWTRDKRLKAAAAAMDLAVK